MSCGIGTSLVALRDIALCVMDYYLRIRHWITEMCKDQSILFVFFMSCVVGTRGLKYDVMNII